MYKFSYTSNDKDYWEFNKYHLFNSSANKRGLLFLRLIIPIALLIGSIVGMYEDGVPFDVFGILSLVLVCGGLSTIWWFLAKPFNLFFLWINIRMIKKDGKLPYNSESFIEFNEEDFTEKTEQGESKVKYSIIEKVAIVKKWIYIYTNATRAYIIPDYVFETTVQKDEFIEFIFTKAKNATRDIKIDFTNYINNQSPN